MQLNEDSLKKVDDVIAKTYYFWINEDDRLTLEVVDIKDKPLQECVGITLDTINKMNSKMLNEMPKDSEKWAMADAELERRGDTMPTEIEISNHAIDKASLRVRNQSSPDE